MKRFLLKLTLCVSPFALSLGGVSHAQDPAPRELLDVPPCSYAADAVRRLTRLGILQGFPSSPSELAQNAVRQVFEGLRCGDVAWTARFIAGLPQGYAAGIGQLGAPLRPNFEFTVLGTQVSQANATVRYRLRYRETPTTLTERTGVAELIPDDQTGWRVQFTSLQTAGLPFFPPAR
ncbi:hypothetical protein [Deinococcus peraridilitoris]|uniref:SLH domain-containing protein n=1 Tax=Deinococcus peraridilitoris (strain DSM 19664 / LMG 22246 / CIP 109416 / KR-200) TaxID=937777 RepID=L0A0B4_DEIPD|nr:hypothetical protein [Deinococcus peraridilitoris]AFZ66899.1 hypothetical protein Deipe_1350 [Deinococcus peraridilitoris DSM 19664]